MALTICRCYFFPYNLQPIKYYGTLRTLIQKLKNRQMLYKSRTFGMCCISKIINDRTFFVLQMLATPLIDLGNSKEVTAVLKL